MPFFCEVYNEYYYRALMKRCFAGQGRVICCLLYFQLHSLHLHLFFVVALQVYFALPSLQGFLFSFHLPAFIWFITTFTLHWPVFFRKTTSAMLRRGYLSIPLSPDLSCFSYLVSWCKITNIISFSICRKLLNIFKFRHKNIRNLKI